MKKKNFNILLRKYSFGGTLDTLSKLIPFAIYYKKKINLINLNINPKKEGSIFIKNIKNLNFVQFLKYKEENFIFTNKKILKEKFYLVVKSLCIKSAIFSFLIKFIFFIFSMNLTVAKKRYRDFFHQQNYADALYNLKNFDYLKKFEIFLDESKFQKIYLNRNSFDIIGEELYEHPIVRNKYICLYLREKSYNVKNPFLKKNDKIIWYNLSNFEDGLNSIFDKNLNVINLSLMNDDLNINNKKYISTNSEKNLSDKKIFSIAKNCEFFLSTGGGRSELAKIFKKPILRVDHEYNALNNFDFSTEQDHVLFGKIFSKKKKRFLSIKEQFESLDKLFPKIKYNLNFYFNHDDFTLVQNSNEEIKNLIKNYNFDNSKINSTRETQIEIFNIKNFYIKKYLPDYFYYVNSNYPINPIICKKFFDDTKYYSDYLEKDTITYNPKLL